MNLHIFASFLGFKWAGLAFFWSIIAIGADFHNIQTYLMKLVLSVAPLHPDRTTLFQKMAIPKFTWNLVTTNLFPEIENLLDCGSQCSISNYNTLLYNDTTSMCILANV